MRYQLSSISQDIVTRLSDNGLGDEVSLMRLTVQDLVDYLEQQPDVSRRIAVGSMLRDAIDSLSRVIERAARLPASDTVPIGQVRSMLDTMQAAIMEFLPDGVARQLIMNVKSAIAGISIREEPSALVLRTCEMMDNSVPRIE